MVIDGCNGCSYSLSGCDGKCELIKICAHIDICLTEDLWDDSRWIYEFSQPIFNITLCNVWSVFNFNLKLHKINRI